MGRRPAGLCGVSHIFRHAIVRPPGENFAEGLTTVDLGAPDFAKAISQHEAYCAALERCGLELTQLKADLRYPDSTFVEDTAVLAERCSIITRPGDPSRLGEETEIRKALASWFPALDEIHSPGTVDGGDICEAGSHFFIGLSKRTNEEGAKQLVAILARHGYTSEVVDVRKVPGMLHVKSGVSYLGDGRLAAIGELADHPAFASYGIVRVDAGEAYAANCVRVNGWVLAPAWHPKTGAAIRALGLEVIELDMSEFQKMDGGLSCLSLRF